MAELQSEQDDSSQEKAGVKMASYLEKRGKLRVMSTWKRYWFVLEGRLLLYYKSELEYINLSACRGSINMGLASCVRPGAIRGPAHQGYVIEVVTRSQVITLRSKDRVLQEQWLQALLDSMALPHAATPIRRAGAPLHFRYSLETLPTLSEILYCKLSDVKVAAKKKKKKFTVQQHVKREKHKRGLQKFQDEKKLQQMLLGQTSEIAEEIRGQFIEVEQLIGCVKKVFLKAPSRVASFKSEAPNVPLPPAFILTRWGTWIEACFYYCENFQVVKKIDSFDSNETTSI
uniref:PH domain-containing protein n=1 Tax=Timema cristinae TaxID=61476 RepID=A0A7R9CJG1_TIMCR|nr:unnamed protein product [Timema cristinae]